MFPLSFTLNIKPNWKRRSKQQVELVFDEFHQMRRKRRQTKFMQNQDSEQLLVSKHQIARRYDVSERTIQEWMQKKIPFLKIGYMVRFDIRSCDTALQQYAVTSR